MSETNGHEAVTRIVSPDPVPDLAVFANVSIAISDEEKAGLQLLEKSLGDAKYALANIQIQIMTLEQERMSLAQKVVDGTRVMTEIMKSTAKTHGIDVEDQTKRWDLNIAKGTFTRTA